MKKYVTKPTYRLAAWMLVFLLLLGIIPANAFAAPDDGSPAASGTESTVETAASTETTEAAAVLTVETAEAVESTDPPAAAPSAAGEPEPSPIMPVAVESNMHREEACIYATDGSHNMPIHQVNVDGTWKFGYCIEPGVPHGTQYESTPGDTSADWNGLSRDQKRALGLVLIYGAPNTLNSSNTKTQMAQRLATQVIVHEIIQGERMAVYPYTRTGSTLYHTWIEPSHGVVMQIVSRYHTDVNNTYLNTKNWLGSADYSSDDVYNAYHAIEDSLLDHGRIPSFTTNLQSEATGGRYVVKLERQPNGAFSATLTDTNDALEMYDIRNTSDLTFSKSGNQLTITTGNPRLTGTVVSLTRTLPNVEQGGSTFLYFGGNENQKLLTIQSVKNDPIPAYFSVELDRQPSTVKIIKKTSDGKNLAGWQFSIYDDPACSTLLSGPHTTDASGNITADGLYPSGDTVYVKELGNSDPAISDRYKCATDNPQAVTIQPGQTASVTFSNDLRTGGLEIVKTTSGSRSLAGWQFSIYHDASCTSLLAGPFTTDSSGKIAARTVGALETGTAGRTVYVKELGHSDQTVNACYYCGSDNPQAVKITEGQTATVSFYNDLKRGGLSVTKTAEDGLVAGIRFHLSGTSLSGIAVDEYAVTDASGVATFKNILIGSGYVLEEVDTALRYVVPDKQVAAVEWNKVTQKSFDNVLKRGSLSVTKTAEDGLVAGIRFHLSGTSLSGIAVDEYAVTDASGVATFKNILIGSSYTLEEVDTAIRYVVPDSQTAVVEWNKVTQKSFDNRLKKWNATVTKSDAETGAAQGDATLAGAVYGVYHGEDLVDAYTTDASGSFTTKYYVCGDDWSIREITPPVGYLPDETSHHVGAEAKRYTVEYNSTELSVTEQVIKGKIAIIKHTDDGSTQLETPEEGATFEVYLKASGSYDAAKKTERDILTCDENGFAETKLLPYGIYTVHQAKGWDGRELLPDFDVYIAKDGRTYHYLANDGNFKSYLKIVKVDAETGKPIPYAGAGFQIYRPDGSLVTQNFTYPEITTIDTFYTTAEGFLITPEPPEYGTGYSLVEVEAPFGYVRNSDPVYFDVTAENAAEENAVVVVKVVKENTAQKGVIKVVKTGEVFASVTESDGVYQPVYAVQGLPGAVYEITAAEDIYTLDGTLRYSAGEVVDTITTDETGSAQTKPLYLGSYEVREITAPYGMILNPDPVSVELTYAGQEVEITETATAFYNERQKVQIGLSKVMEQNETFDIGENGEILSVQFGLYAAEDLTAADGTVIPADGLLEIVSVNKNGSTACMTDLPFGSYYLKETATDSRYILSDEKYPIVFEYAGQDTALVEIKANEGKTIDNVLIYGEIHGLKKDRETEETIAGAVFGLFRADETEFTEKTAILTAVSGEDGVFAFKNVPFGNWQIVELKPAEGFLPNSDIYHVQVNEDAEIIEITAVNDRIPEIGTTATVDREKEVNATEVFTLEDGTSCSNGFMK